MNATLSDAIQLIIGAVVGGGVFMTMEKHGYSVFERDSRMKGLSILFIFCSAWLIGITLLVACFWK